MADRDTFVGYIDKSGIIWSKGFGQQKDIEIGWDMQATNELRSDRDAIFAKAEKYLEELYAAGVRQRPQTPEQTAKEQAILIKEMREMMSAMQTEIKSLKEEPKWEKTGEKPQTGPKVNLTE